MPPLKYRGLRPPVLVFARDVRSMRRQYAIFTVDDMVYTGNRITDLTGRVRATPG